MNKVGILATLKARTGGELSDTFKDDEGRNAHVTGEVARALFARAEELFVSQPQIQMVDILAEKL